MPPPAAQTDSAAVADVQLWLSANLRKLEEFIDQELNFQIESDKIRENQITRDEVVDEVIVSALSHEGGRRELLSTESWFHRLAVQAIRRLVHDNADTANISLDAPAGIQNVTGSDENVLQYHQPDDSLPEESIIRDESVRTPEEIMAGDEMVAQLDVVLSGVKSGDREAFVYTRWKVLPWMKSPVWQGVQRNRCASPSTRRVPTSSKSCQRRTS